MTLAIAWQTGEIRLGNAVADLALVGGAAIIFSEGVEIVADARRRARRARRVRPRRR